MKKFLLLFCILSITKTTEAQLFRKNWEVGSYIDSSGKEFSGLIYYSLPDASIFKGKGDYLQYKNSTDAEKQKIPSNQIKSFVISTDSFTVSHFITLEKFPFLQIMINHQTKLYYSAINSGSMPVVGAALLGGALGAAAMHGKNGSAYYYGSDPDHLTLLKGKNFVETMSTLMADKPEVVAKIKDKTFKLGSITDLLNYYKTGVLPKSSLDDVYE